MRTATIKGLSGTWGSGIAMLALQEGDDVLHIPCENAPTVRALDSIFGNVILPGHRAEVPVGQEIQFALDDSGLLAAIAPAGEEVFDDE